MSTLRISLDGTVREDVILKKYLASHGKYLQRAEREIREAYRRSPVIATDVPFQEVRLFGCGNDV